MGTIIGLLMFLLAIATMVGLLALKLYGIYLCFSKKWYLGAVALVVPLFAEVIGAAKLFFKKDLLS